MSEAVHVLDTHKTPVRFPSVIAALGFAGFCVWLGGQVTEVRRDITDLKGKHVYTPEEIKKMVDDRVDELWARRRDGVRMKCHEFPARGVWADCNEVKP